MRYLVLLTLLCSSLAVGAAREVDEYHWEGVERIVAIGDLHGDYENYLATLQAAGLADSKGKWTGGSAHLVQTGDIPDRGPDTGRIIEHIIKLDKQARRTILTGVMSSEAQGERHVWMCRSNVARLNTVAASHSVPVSSHTLRRRLNFLEFPTRTAFR